MSEIKTRKYRCNGCGEDRPCYLTSNQEPHTLDHMQIDDLKCVLDETNRTSYNWEEVQANGISDSHGQVLPINSVSQRSELLSFKRFISKTPLVELELYSDEEFTDLYLKANCD